ncbi:MAG: DUF5939 domain-containing protein [Polyangiaceae bacterium]
MARILRGTEEQFRLFIEEFPWPDAYLARGKTIDFFGAYTIAATPKEIWRLVSDTSRLNRCLRIPASIFREASGRRTGKASYFGKTQAWREPPWEWISEEMVICTKEYSEGSARVLRCVLHLRPDADGTEFRVYYGFIAKGWINCFVASRFAKSLSQAYDRLAPRLCSFLSGGSRGSSPLERKSSRLSDAVLERMDRIGDSVVERGHDRQVIDAICKHVQNADMSELYRLRMKSLARQWDLPYRDVLETSLEATRLGLLSLSWDVLCPHCRGVRVEAKSLAEIPESANCEACNLFFATRDSKQIEVTFHVHPSIRKIRNIVYCAAEAANKPHVFFQLHLRPSEQRSVDLCLRPGRYLLRDSGEKKNYPVVVEEEGGASQIQAPFDDKVVLTASRDVRVQLANSGSDATTFSFETVAWTDDYVRPADVLGLQQFRDLFTEETLGDEVILSVGVQTVLFSDIVGSTSLYLELGDPAAFTAVKKHFRQIFSAVDQHHGAIVKTIGDAVMAVFARPDDAVRAARYMQAAAAADEGPISIRISMYSGSCLAVNLNTGLDYFGAVVNKAAKMQELVGSNETAIASSVLEESRVKDVIEELGLVRHEESPRLASFGEDVAIFVLGDQ